MTTMTTAERDRLYVDKAYQYLADTDFDGNVEQYLRSMADDYVEQARTMPNPTDAASMIALAVVVAKRDAYLDAVRVFDDAILAALRFAREA